MKEPIKIWPHKDATGKKIGEIHRFVSEEGKKSDLPFYYPNGEEQFKAGIPPALKLYPLFGLDSIKDFIKPIYIVEGQKCQNAMATLGLQAVTSILGARSAEKSDWAPLEEAKKIYLLPDNDAAGESYIRAVYHILTNLKKGNKSMKIKIFRVGEQYNAE